MFKCFFSSIHFPPACFHMSAFPCISKCFVLIRFLRANNMNQLLIFLLSKSTEWLNKREEHIRQQYELDLTKFSQFWRYVSSVYHISRRPLQTSICERGRSMSSFFCSIDDSQCTTLNVTWYLQKCSSPEITQTGRDKPHIRHHYWVFLDSSISASGPAGQATEHLHWKRITALERSVWKKYLQPRFISLEWCH